jgi:uncharacterized protein (TIGR01777 family)
MAASWHGKVLVSGSSGLIGRALLASLASSGYQVFRLVRVSSGEPAGEVGWDPAVPLSPQAASGYDAVVHLAGESIVGRWTEAKKKRIRDSRVVGTQNLARGLAAAPERPRVLVCASAIGFYGNRGDELLSEKSASGSDFLSGVCREWEAASQSAADAGIRVAQVRIGIVLSKDGGALARMLTPFRLGVGGPIGNGRQWWSWVHVADVVGAIHHVLKTDLLQGPVNVVAPRPVTNTDFTRILAKALSRPAIFPMPAFVARAAFGQMADELLLASQRVEPAKLVSSGYPFRFSDLGKALENLLSSNSRRFQ